MQGDPSLHEHVSCDEFVPDWIDDAIERWKEDRVFTIGEVTNLTAIGSEEPDNYLGRVTVLGVEHHVQLIAVREGEDVCQEAVSDPYDRLVDVYRLNDGLLHTIRVPGLPGEYVMVIYPFGD